MSTSIRASLGWLATAVVLTLCLAPQGWVAREHSVRYYPHTDKLVHFAMFALFGLGWAMSRPLHTLTRARVVVILISAVALAVATEVAQGHPLIHRDPDPLDAVADIVGAVAALGAACWAARLVRGPAGPAPEPVA